jgi:sulfide dehydrogenase cytochrome subunit
MTAKDTSMQARPNLILALALATQLAPAFGADPILPGQRLYATCAACHGTNGAGSGTTLAVLAGQPRDVLATSLRNFKTGSRPATVMQQIAKGYTDEQIEQIAAYLAMQK